MEEIQVIIKNELFRSEDSFYRVYLVTMNDPSEKSLTINGTLPDLFEGQIVTIIGDYQNHPRFGLQFVVQKVQPVTLLNEESLIKYLSSSNFPGIGVKKAQKIKDYYGLSFINQLLNEGFVFTDDFLTEKEQQILREGVLDQKTSFELINFCYEYGISMKNAMKIKTKYKENALSIIYDNPYQLITEISGIGFKTVDKIARKLGFDLMDSKRLEAVCVYETMQYCLISKDTYCDKEMLFLRCKKYGFSSELFDKTLFDCEVKSLLIIENNKIYHPSQYYAEISITNFIQSIPYKPYIHNDHELDVLIDMIQSKHNITFDILQKEVLYSFFKYDRLFITGGPGTGKSTIIQALIELIQLCTPQYEIALCAPTGRSSKRLKELVDVNVSTIHSLLEFNMETNKFRRDENTPLSCDVLIVDEFSMVDNYVFGALSKAATSVRKLVLIGDKDQLPSVTCGFVIRDILNSSYFNVITLDHNYRQQNGSNIVCLANEINQKQLTKSFFKNDVTFIESSRFTKEIVSDLFYQYLQEGYSLDDIVVLCSKYDGNFGIDAFNQCIQEKVNPFSKLKRETKFGYQVFREGDKVIQLKNQPDDHVYNGDMGIIIDVIPKEESDDHKVHVIIDFNGAIVDYVGSDLFNIKHGYCCSVHKAQGSEFPIVIFVGNNEHEFMLDRRMIYTAFTRAQQKLYIFSHLDLLKRVILKDPSQFIQTQLLDRLASKNMIK